MALGNPYGAMVRCIMNPDKTVAYFLDPNNSNYKMDGTAVDWAVVESTGQNVMVQIPKFYFCKKWDANTQSFYFGVSSVIKDTPTISANEWEIHPAFFKDQTKACDDSTAVAVEVPYRYIGAFVGYTDVLGRYRSIPGKTPTSNNITGLRTAAKTMGLGYCFFDYYLLNALQMIYITEFGNPDSQSMLGHGLITADTTGTTLVDGNNSNTYGITSGTSYTKPMTYRGIENLFGPHHMIYDGILNSTGTIKVSNKYYNNSGTGYIDLCTVPSASGFIKNINTDPNGGFFPSATSAVASCGLYDYTATPSTGIYAYTTQVNSATSNICTYTGIFCNDEKTLSTTVCSRLAL